MPSNPNGIWVIKMDRGLNITVHYFHFVNKTVRNRSLFALKKEINCRH